MNCLKYQCFTQKKEKEKEKETQHNMCWTPLFPKTQIA